MSFQDENDDLPDGREISGVMRGLKDIAEGRTRPFEEINRELEGAPCDDYQ